jgi:hypothetical protein
MEAHGVAELVVACLLCLYGALMVKDGIVGTARYVSRVYRETDWRTVRERMLADRLARGFNREEHGYPGMVPHIRPGMVYNARKNRIEIRARTTGSFWKEIKW